MPDRKYLQRIELLRGTGRIYEGSQEIATANYHIEVFQEKIECITDTGMSTVGGLKELCGTIDPVDSSIRVLFGKDLTLVFEDGRKVDFAVSNANISANTGSIVASSGIR